MQPLASAQTRVTHARTVTTAVSAPSAVALAGCARGDSIRESKLTKSPAIIGIPPHLCKVVSR